MYGDKVGRDKENLEYNNDEPSRDDAWSSDAMSRAASDSPPLTVDSASPALSPSIPLTGDIYNEGG